MKKLLPSLRTSRSELIKACSFKVIDAGRDCIIAPWVPPIETTLCICCQHWLCLLPALCAAHELHEDQLAPLIHAKQQALVGCCAANLLCCSVGPVKPEDLQADSSVSDFAYKAASILGDCELCMHYCKKH